MRKIFSAERSAYALFLIFLLAGLAALYRTFLGKSAPLSFSNPLWILVAGMYILAPIALLAHQITYARGKTPTIPLPAWWNSAKLLKAFTLFAGLFGVGFVISLDPIDRLIVHTLNSFWLNYPLALLAVVAIKTLLNKGSAGKIQFFDLLNAGFLHVGLFFIAPIMIYYPLVNRSVILVTSLLVTTAYIDLPLPQTFFKKFLTKRTMGITMAVVLLLSTAAFLYFSINGLITTPSIMDEGSYSIKGYLFATGRYFPYQDNGPWTNKMPLAFMIPGWIQLIFGPNLFAIRAAALVMQAITAICLFILGRRFYGFKGGALAVAIFALNPSLPSFYSQGNTQVVSIFLISLVMVFTLGRDRSTLSLFFGNLIAGSILLTRENMTPFVVFMNFFLIFEYGWRKALMPISMSWIVFIIGHIFYWPGILKVWAFWVPHNLSPFLDAFRNTGGGRLMWQNEGRNTGFLTSLGSLTQGINSNLVNMIAIFGMPLLFPNIKVMATKPNFKRMVFLWVSAFFLTIIHAYITLDDGTCVYCFSSYISFFTPIAIILFVISLGLISEHSSSFSKVGFLALLGIFFTSVWYNHRQDLRWLTQLRLTSILNASGFQFLSDLLESNFKIDYEVSKSLVPVLFGFGVFVIIMALGYWIWKKWLAESYPASNLAGLFAILGLAIPMILNLVFFATNPVDCAANVPAEYAAATQKVASLVPAGKRVFWLGESTAILLGLPNEFYPQQFNEGFGFRVGSVDELAERYGKWNENLARAWSEETDYMLIEENKMDNPILNNVDFSNFKQIGKTPRVNRCDKTAYYHIYERIR